VEAKAKKGTAERVETEDDPGIVGPSGECGKWQLAATGREEERRKN